MTIDVSPRQAGKTYRLLKQLKENPIKILLCFSVAERNRLRKENPDLSNRIFLWEEVCRGKLMGTKYERYQVMVDNADLILQHYLKMEITDITLSGKAS